MLRGGRICYLSAATHAIEARVPHTSQVVESPSIWFLVPMFPVSRVHRPAGCAGVLGKVGHGTPWLNSGPARKPLKFPAHNPTHNANPFAMDSTTYAAFGSPRGFVSYCKTYPHRADKGEVGGSSPPGPPFKQILSVHNTHGSLQLARFCVLEMQIYLKCFRGERARPVWHG